MELSPKILTILVLASLGLSVLSLLVLLATSPRGRLRHGGDGSLDRAMVKTLKEHGRAIAELQGAARKLAGDDRRLAQTLRGTIQRVGLVRYDAFEDMGGHLSFSGALLDANGDGLVITSINGRADTRCYAKPVSAGTSRFNLSDEEAEAIRIAMNEPVTARAS